MKAAAAIGRNPDWREALTEVVTRVTADVEDADLAVLFASAGYAQEFPELIEHAHLALRSRVLIGCSGQGVIGPSTEIEGEPALALLAVSLPGALLETRHISQAELQQCDSADVMRGIAPRGLPCLSSS